MALGRETYVHTSPFVLPPRWKPEVGHWRQRVFQPVGVSAARRSPLAAHVSTANTASTVENKTASSNPVAADASSAACREESSGVLTVTSESLRLLEWPALCRQAAAFCEIPLAAQQLLRDGLRLGRSQEESEKLLQQTEEAQQADLALHDVYDLFSVINAAEEGQLLRASHLNAVASTLLAVERLRQQLHVPSVARDRQAEASASSSHTQGQRGFLSLAAVIKPAALGAPGLLAAIQHCIGDENGLVLDRASSQLAAARRERRDNLKSLRAESEKWARQIFTQKASENSQVMSQRGRLCVSVKAGRQGDLPKGSVKMGSSRSGSTLYIEPEPLVHLNNAEARLAGQEAEAEHLVLLQLTQQVAAESVALTKAMNALLELDVINARARHSAWLSGTKPHFHTDDASTSGSVHLPGARHPLLMQNALSPLPELLSPGENDFESGFMGGVSALQLEDEVAGDDGGSVEAQPTAELPVPVDLTVPPGKTLVVLTGPNTGGKTASLKALGLLALMAKAGLFLPVDGSRGCSLAWFDQVLADVGDSQDLTQNLSTFSGHLHRLKRITAAVKPSTLVLLDELGSGTDPVEGGALAAVLLKWLLNRAGLTFCTTHHAELKELAASDERFVNANVEFNAQNLLPTYRLLWGEAGESQALAVAEGLGFDSDIVAEAHTIAHNTNFASKPGQHAGQLKDKLASEVEEVQEHAQAAAAARGSVETRLEQLETGLAELRGRQRALQERSKAEVQHAEQMAKQRVQGILDSFSESRLSFEDASQKLMELKSSALEQRTAAGSLFGQEEANSGPYEPRCGETVRLLSMGGKPAKVIKEASGSNQLAVRMGKLTINVRKSDVAAADSSTAPQAVKGQKHGKKGPLEGSPLSNGARGLLKVQIPENTADLRGMRQADVVQALERAFDDCPSDSVLFVVHGHGSGAVKSAVRQHLQRHSLVKRFYEEPNSAGGCTVVEFK